MMDKAPRSPSYPAISLPEALTRLEMLYEREGTTPADREVIAQSLGYTSRNGASDTILAAFGHYSLLEDAGNKRLKISRIGLNILLGLPGEADYDQAVIEAANAPTLFSELSTQFGDGRFSNRNVENYLIKGGFNQKAAAKAAKAYRETLEFRMNQTTKKQTTPRNTDEDLTSTALPETVSIKPQPSIIPQNSSYQRTLSIPIDEDMDVQLVFQGQLTDERIETLIQFLQIMKLRFTKRQPPFSVPVDEDGRNE